MHDIAHPKTKTTAKNYVSYGGPLLLRHSSHKVQDLLYGPVESPDGPNGQANIALHTNSG